MMGSTSYSGHQSGRSTGKLAAVRPGGIPLAILRADGRIVGTGHMDGPFPFSAAVPAESARSARSGEPDGDVSSVPSRDQSKSAS